MSLETALKTIATTLLPRWYPDEAPEGAALPYAVWQQVGGQGLVYAEGTMPDRENAYVQVRIWAASRIEANNLSRQLEALLCGSTALQAQPMAARVSEKEGPFYGARQDFDIWVTRPSS